MQNMVSRLAQVSKLPEMDESALKAFRKALREQSIAAREAMDLHEHAAKAESICNSLAAVIARMQPRRLGFCGPFRGEVDVRAEVARWLAQDATRIAALPVVMAPRTPMTFRRWLPGCAMVADVYGIEIPAAAESVVPDCLVLPLVAFDDAGYRLGYGAGYFDRTIETLAASGPRPTVIGIGFECVRCPTIHPQPYDAPLDWLVTEAGIFARDGAVMRPAQNSADRC